MQSANLSSMFRTGYMLLGELRKQAEADGRLHLAVCSLAAALAALVIAMRPDTEAGIITVDSLLRTWPSMLLYGGLAALGLSLLYFWARAHYDAYSQMVLLDSGLLYLALEHEPSEELRTLLTSKKLVSLQGGAGLSFRERMLALQRAYSACCHRLLYQAYPAGLRWLDLGVILGALFCGLWIAVIILTRYLPWLQNPYGPPPGQDLAAALRLLGVVMLSATLARGTLRRARTDGLRLGLAAALEGEG